jgi:hypothetical protein
MFYRRTCDDSKLFQFPDPGTRKLLAGRFGAYFEADSNLPVVVAIANVGETQHPAETARAAIVPLPARNLLAVTVIASTCGYFTQLPVAQQREQVLVSVF